jgi:hypothetical protein
MKDMRVLAGLFVAASVLSISEVASAAVTCEPVNPLPAGRTGALKCTFSNNTGSTQASLDSLTFAGTGGTLTVDNVVAPALCGAATTTLTPAAAPNTATLQWASNCISTTDSVVVTFGDTAGGALTMTSGFWNQFPADGGTTPVDTKPVVPAMPATAVGLLFLALAAGGVYLMRRQRSLTSAT